MIPSTIFCLAVAALCLGEFIAAPVLSSSYWSNNTYSSGVGCGYGLSRNCHSCVQTAGARARGQIRVGIAPSILRGSTIPQVSDPGYLPANIHPKFISGRLLGSRCSTDRPMVREHFICIFYVHPYCISLGQNNSWWPLLSDQHLLSVHKSSQYCHRHNHICPSTPGHMEAAHIAEHQNRPYYNFRYGEHVSLYLDPYLCKR